MPCAPRQANRPLHLHYCCNWRENGLLLGEYFPEPWQSYPIAQWYISCIFGRQFTSNPAFSHLGLLICEVKLQTWCDALNSPETPDISSKRKWTLTLGRLSSYCDYCGVVQLRDIKLKYIQNGFWQGQSTACIKMSLKRAVIVMAHKDKSRSLSLCMYRIPHWHQCKNWFEFQQLRLLFYLQTHHHNLQCSMNHPLSRRHVKGFVRLICMTDPSV